jgi:hypothetical protein
MFTKLMKCVLVGWCLCLAIMNVGCGGGGGGDETVSPSTVVNSEQYATIDELAAAKKTPEALGTWMTQNITYLSQDMAKWKYLSPSEVFSGRQGDCIHQSAFIKEVLTKNGYACKLLFVLRFYSPTHAVCYWTDANGKLWTLGEAWGGQQALNGPYDNEHTMATKILEWLIAQSPGEPQTARYGNFDTLAYGINWNDFYQPFVNGPTVP